jgi:hypothetical protein
MKEEEGRRGKGKEGGRAKEKEKGGERWTETVQGGKTEVKGMEEKGRKKGGGRKRIKNEGRKKSHQK